MKISFLYGADLGTLFRLFREQKFRISLSAIPSILLHLFMALINSILSLPERFLRFKEDPKNPIFIIGHWRSGTTHLHNLMTIDNIYQAPNTFQAAFPHNFLFSEKWMAPLIDKISPGVRLMDAMKMVMSSVQEEEIAMASLGAPSSYLAIHFPNDDVRYRTHVSFREAEEKDLNLWKKAYQKFLRKIIAKNGNEKPLLLKSPANTARIRLILEMYPNARFIHIHRNPYETIRSTMHLYDSWFSMANFQSLAKLKETRNETILNMYEEMHRCWLEEKSLIPEERLMVMGFEELKKTPVEAIQKVYDFLGDGELDEKALREYLASIKRYRQNKYDELSPEIVAEINRRFGFVFEEFGYHLKPILSM